MYLEPKISTPTNEQEKAAGNSKFATYKLSVKPYSSNKLSGNRELIRELVAEYWELARKQRLYCQGATEFEGRRSLTSQIALQTERLIGRPALPDSPFEVTVNPRFKRKKEKDVEDAAAVKYFHVTNLEMT